MLSGKTLVCVRVDDRFFHLSPTYSKLRPTQSPLNSCPVREEDVPQLRCPSRLAIDLPLEVVGHHLPILGPSSWLLGQDPDQPPPFARVHEVEVHSHPATLDVLTATRTDSPSIVGDSIFYCQVLILLQGLSTSLPRS